MELPPVNRPNPSPSELLGDATQSYHEMYDFLHAILLFIAESHQLAKRAPVPDLDTVAVLGSWVQQGSQLLARAAVFQVLEAKGYAITPVAFLDHLRNVAAASMPVAKNLAEEERKGVSFQDYRTGCTCYLCHFRRTVEALDTFMTVERAAEIANQRDTFGPF